MNKKDLVKRIAVVMREKNIRKPVSLPRQVFHISDDDGNKKDFIVRKTDKSVLFTTDDIEAIIDTCLSVIMDAIKHGEPISIHGFGTLWLKYKQSRSAKLPGTDELIEIDAHYMPKFTYGKDLRMCAKIYEISLLDNPSVTSPITDDLEDGE